MSEFYTNVATSGGNILLRGIRNGQAFKEKVPLKPYHFVPSKQATDYQDLRGNYVSRMDFDSISDARDFASKYEDIENFEIFGFKRYVYPFIRDTYPNMKYDYNKISIVYFDIEVAADAGFPSIELADKEITAISVRKDNLKLVFSCVEYTPSKDVIYIKCRDEKDLLYKFIDAWQKLNPDIISGWNIEFFDIPYLVNRIKSVCGETVAKQLSPWNQIHQYDSVSKFGADQFSFKIIGITTVDLMQAYIKFTFKNQESFSLNHIAHLELGEKKIDYSEYDSLHDLYLKDPQKFIEYNVLDSDLVYRINQKTGLINQIITLAYTAKVNFADAFTSVLLWEVIIDNHLFNKGIVTPTHTKKQYKNEPIMGAFVKEPRPGKYKWVAALDLDSLYPHLMMQYNISPETLGKCFKELRHIISVEDIIEQKMMHNSTVRNLIETHNFGYTPNGAFFKNDKRGFLAELMDTMYQERKIFKKKMIQAKKDYEKNPSDELDQLITQYNNMQMALKICLNSAYGALSNQYFMFFDINLAEAITYAGQLAIKWISEELNKYLNKIAKTKNFDYVIANDTDSCYLNLDPIVKQFLPEETDSHKIVEFITKFCEDKINPFINKSYDKMKEYTNAYENKMSMKVESISDAGIWRAKKKYALNVWWDEGVFYDKPKVKIKGLSAIQSSTPQICRDKMKIAIGLILNGDKSGFHELIDKFESEFKKSNFEDIAKTSGVSDLDKYKDSSTIYTKGTPMHVRGSLLYNKMIKELNIDNIYQKINNGDKIKFCYLKMPNPIHENVISIYNKLPKQFDIDKFIDYELQFNKVFLEPINDISKLVDWDLNNRSSLDALFG